MRSRRTRLTVAACVALIAALVSLPSALADGTETLGTPSVTIASGTDVLVAGIGMNAFPNTPNSFSVSVPAGASVKQVLLYWEGHYTDHTNPSFPVVPGDAVIGVNGNVVTGTLVGGPTAFFQQFAGPVTGTETFHTYRADITGLGLVAAGANTLTITDMLFASNFPAGFPFNQGNDGVGVVVIYDDGSSSTVVGVRDGQDLAFQNFAPPLNTTVPQTFTFAPHSSARSATLATIAGGVRGLDFVGLRGNVIAGQFNTGQTFTIVDGWQSNQGFEFDALNSPINVPAGASSLTVQALSQGGDRPASFAWIAASLSIEVPPPPPPDSCFVIIDEEGVDNDFRSVESAAASHGVRPDFLVNDDRPTEVGNPDFRWNELFPGDVVLMPTGQVDDEGWFSPPPPPQIRYADDRTTSLTYDQWIQAFVNGTLPQDKLDKVRDVMPLRNQDLVKLVGKTCVAVVYDSDISINYKPLYANLQGARLGLFTFTVLAVEVPGAIPESKSSTTLYDLWLRVESPKRPGAGFFATIRDHEPDSIQVEKATWSAGVLTVKGKGNFPGAVMTVSVDGADGGTNPNVAPFLLELPMPLSNGGWKVTHPTATDLRGRRLSIQTDEGGAYNVVVTGR